MLRSRALQRCSLRIDSRWRHCEVLGAYIRRNVSPPPNYSSGAIQAGIPAAQQCSAAGIPSQLSQPSAGKLEAREGISCYIKIFLM